MVELPGRRGITPAFGYTAPHPSGRGTSTLRIKTLPSTHYGPLRHPVRPGLSLAGVRLVVTRRHRGGLPVLRRISVYEHAASSTPAGPLGRIARGTAYSTRF